MCKITLVLMMMAIDLPRHEATEKATRQMIEWAESLVPRRISRTRTGRYIILIMSLVWAVFRRLYCIT